MLSREILRHIVTNVCEQNKEDLLVEFLFSLNEQYCNDNLEYVLSILINPENAITEKDIDMEYIQNNIGQFVYNGDAYNFSEISLKEINNVKCFIIIEYKCVKKDSTEPPITAEIPINFVNYKKVIKKN